MMECKGMGSVHSGFYGALFNGDEEQGRLFDDLVGCIHSADEGKAKAIYLTGSHAPPSSSAGSSQWMFQCLHQRSTDGIEQRSDKLTGQGCGSHTFLATCQRTAAASLS